MMSYKVYGSHHGRQETSIQALREYSQARGAVPYVASGVMMLVTRPTDSEPWTRNELPVYMRRHSWEVRRGDLLLLSRHML